MKLSTKNERRNDSLKVCVTMGVVAAKKRRELLNICVREIHVYSFPDPTLELSYTCMWNGTIFIRLCSSHGGIFLEKILRVCYLISALKSYMGANNCIDFFSFLPNSKNVAYRISFVISVLTLTEFASHTQTLNHCVKYFYRNKRVTL